LSQVVFSTKLIMLLMRPGGKRHGAPAKVASKREFSCIQFHIMVVNTDVLNSWKEVATYLGRGIRTVQRWERELGLPIRRPRGKPRGPVIAFRRELDQWLHSAPTAEPRIAEGQMAETQPEPEGPAKLDMPKAA
jgi:hypothetical protein